MVPCALSSSIVDVLAVIEYLESRLDVQVVDSDLLATFFLLSRHSLRKLLLVDDACGPIGLIRLDLSPLNILHTLAEASVVLP